MNDDEDADYRRPPRPRVRLVRSEAATQRHSVAQVLTQMTIVSEPTLLGLLANKYGLKPVCCAMERKMLLGRSSP
jgi:hypothetical protein